MLADGEAEVYFAPGRGFTIWADAVVHHKIRAEGLIGRGVIRGLDSPSVFSRGDGQRESMSSRGAYGANQALAGPPVRVGQLPIW